MNDAEKVACIMRRHHAMDLPGDTNDRKCFECRRRWPCPTWLIAAGQYDETP